MTDIVERLRDMTRSKHHDLMVPEEAAYEIERLRVERDMALAKVDRLEAMRPHWAKGYSTDSVAAQASIAALTQVWSALGVSDQTQCVQKLRAVLAERDRLREAQAAIHALSQRPPGGWLPGEHFQALNKIAALAALKETGHGA